MRVANGEELEIKLPYEEVCSLRLTLSKKKNKKLYYKFGDKFKESRAWLAAYGEIESNATKLWGHYKAKALSATGRGAN